MDAWGALGSERPWDKRPGSFRNLQFGGSTVFASRVDDHETQSAQLELEQGQVLARVPLVSG